MRFLRAYLLGNWVGSKYNLAFNWQIIRIFEMTCCDYFAKKKHENRKKKSGPYEKVNAYTQKPVFEQILTLFIFIMQLVGQSVFIVPLLPGISSSILWIMLGFHYATLIMIGYDYVYLTTKDPVDRMITN
jgi:hypothetical protein